MIVNNDDFDKLPTSIEKLNQAIAYFDEFLHKLEEKKETDKEYSASDSEITELFVHIRRIVAIKEKLQIKKDLRFPFY